MLRSITIALFMLSAAAFVWADDANANVFQWQGDMTPGQTLTIRGISGTVTAGLASGTQAQVTAVKSGTRDDPSQVQILVVTSDSGVSLCAVYPGFPAGQACNCGSNSTSLFTSDVQVAFTVSVPAGVALDIGTVNGDIRATGLTGDFRATSVNGQIAVSTTGAAQATTVNGSIIAALASVEWTGTRSFTTVNGSIDATIPASANVVVHASTVSGTISADFPLTVRGPSGFFCGTESTLNGTLGSGGRDLNLTTVNGSIHLRKSQ